MTPEPLRETRVAKAAVNSAAIRFQRRISSAFWVAAVLLGGFQFWISRQTMNTDGISYLDMADAIARGNWRAAVNGYWSPLYPCLLAAGRLLFRPSAYWEFAVVHLVNFFIFLGAAAAFQFFLSSLVGYVRRRNQAAETSQAAKPLPEWALLSLGYSLFLWSSLALINLSTVSPDMTVALFVFLASALILRSNSVMDHAPKSALLGLVLGLGYLAKTAMMPLSVVFFAAAILAGWRRSSPAASPEESSTRAKVLRLAPEVALGVVVFLLVSGPLVLALSKSKGRLTIGDSARLNWAWYINHIPRYHWQGIPAAGAPVHPTRKLLASPGVYVFDSSNLATYDIWYDPSYWDDGIRPRLDIKTEIGQLRNNLRFYFRFFLVRQIGILAPCIFFILLGLRGKQSLTGLADHAEELLPALAALVMYAPIYVEVRYIAPFVVVLWMALFAAVRVPANALSRRAATYSVAVALAFTLVSLGAGLPDAKGPYGLLEAVRWKSPYLQFEVAEELHRMGIEPGDKVAWIRPKAPARERYDWARLGRVRINAEIPGVEEKAFWMASPETQSQVIQALDGTGAKALISTQPPPAGSTLEWQPVGSTGFYLVFLPESVRSGGKSSSTRTSLTRLS